LPRVEQKSAATLLMELFQDAGFRVILDQYGDPFVVVPSGVASVASEANSNPKGGGVGTGRRLQNSVTSVTSYTNTYPLPIKSEELSRILSKKFYDANEKTIGPDSIKAALQTLAGYSLNQPREMLWNRIGVAPDGSWWLDLGGGRAAWMDGDGWSVTDKNMVLFRSFSHQLPLHEPRRSGDGDLFSLLDFVNFPDVDSQLLFIVWVVCCLVPEIPHPVLYLYGGKGTFKSTAMMVVKEVLDRSSVGLLKLHDDLNQLNQNLDHHWIAFFDNLSKLDEGQSDVLCRAVTGAGWSKRALYTDDSDVTRWFRRCVGVNGINIVSDKPDFTDRAIMLETKPLPMSKRRTDRDIRGDLDRCAGGILGDVLTVICRARKLIEGGFRVEKMPRMADFSLWGAAVSEVLGVGQDYFMNAYIQNIKNVEETIARGNVVGDLLITYLENRITQVDELSFSVHELYETLRNMASDRGYNLKTDFPGDPRWLSNKVRELAPILPSAGVVAKFKRDKKGSKIVFSRFVPTKLDNEWEIGLSRENSWGVLDLREMRDKLAKLREEKPVGGAVEAPVASSLKVSLRGAHDMLLQHEAFRRGERLALEKAQEFLGGLGLTVVEAVKLISGMLRSGELVSPSPGWLIKGDLV
jgi:hypothetical protein